MTDTSAAGAPAGFAERVDQIHVPEPNADRERLMLVLGGVLVAVGLVAVLVGYWGASGTSSPAEQIPYALSGGAFGLGLIVLGCALVTRFSLARLFRFWLARLLAEHQLQTDRTVDVLERIEAVLAASAGVAPGPSSSASASAPGPASAPVDVTASSSSGDDAPRVRREPLRAQPLEKG